jgi:hypothetical protein
MRAEDLLLRLRAAAVASDVEDAVAAFEDALADRIAWVPVGRENNCGTIQSSADPGRALVERVTNAIDAVVEMEHERHQGQPLCLSPKEAASAWLNVPSAGLSAMTPRARQQLADRVVVTIKAGEDRQSRTVVVRDNGTGLTPEEMPGTILSLSESNKLQKHYLAGAYGQGGSATYAVSRYSIIACRRQGTSQVGFTVVRYEDLPPNLFKMGRYVYLTLDGAVLVADASDDFAPGTEVVHYGYDLTKYPSPVGPNSIYGLMNCVLFDPVLPVWLEDEVHRYRRVIKGSRNALNGAVDEGDDATRGPSLSHNAPRYYVELGDFGRVGIEYWVLQAPRDPTSKPIAGFVNPYRPIVLTMLGQSHGEMPLSVVRKDAELPYLVTRLVCHVDCNDLSPQAKRTLFVSNREGAREGQLYERIRQEVVRALASDDDLARLNQEARERNLRERDEQTQQAVRKEVARLLRLEGVRIAEPTGSRAAEQSDDSHGGRRGRRARRVLRPIEIHDPPTYIRILGDPLKFQPGQRRYVRIETDASSEYHSAHDPSRSRVNVVLPNTILHLAGTTPLNGGRMRAVCDASEGAVPGQAGRMRVELIRPGLTVLSCEVGVEVVAAPPARPGRENLSLPEFEVVPVDAGDERWGAFGWPDDVSQVASQAQMEQGKLWVYYSTAFPRFAENHRSFERRDPALASSFTSRYEIWLAVHSLLLQQDDERGSPWGDDGELTEELAAVADRRERCRLAAVAAMVAAREVMLLPQAASDE